jgi:hypothetical protein
LDRGYGLVEPEDKEPSGRFITEHPMTPLKFLLLISGIVLALTILPGLLVITEDFYILLVGLAFMAVVLIVFFARFYDQVRVWNGGIELVNLIRGRRFYEWWDFSGYEFLEVSYRQRGPKKIAVLYLPGLPEPITVGPPMANVEEAWDLIARYVRKRK